MSVGIWKEVRSFKLAFQGILSFFQKDRHGRFQLFILMGSLLLGWAFHCSFLEMILILICGGGVISLEMLNHALEKLADILHPEIDVRIKHLKDVAAGAVLFFSLISLVTVLYILGSKIF